MCWSPPSPSRTGSPVLAYRPVLHNVPQQLGIDIQQTSDGFSLSKSEAGRTIYTIRGFQGGAVQAGWPRRAAERAHRGLRQATTIAYDQIYGDQFTYDPQSGDIKAVGEVHIDLQGNAEGPAKPDQAQLRRAEEPVHLVTRSLTFNQKTGIAQTDEVVNFQTEQATGSAKGAYYDSKQNELELKSDMHIVTTGDHPPSSPAPAGDPESARGRRCC